MVSASDLGSEGREFESWFTRVVFIGKTLNSHSASPHPGAKVGTSNMRGWEGEGGHAARGEERGEEPKRREKGPCEWRGEREERREELPRG